MKNLKYRSVMSAIVMGMLSVFLFTGCEKDTAVAPNNSDGDMIDKFKRLKFQTVITTEENSSNFADNDNKESEFVDPSASGEAEFAPSTGFNNQFTDPQASSYFFGVNGVPNIFEFGGGSFSFNGVEGDFGLGFCGIDLYGRLADTLFDQVDLFIGVSGTYSMDENSGEVMMDKGYFIYAFSYNGGTNLINFNYSTEMDTFPMQYASVIMIEFSEGQDPKEYFSNHGSIEFKDSEVVLSNVSMVDEMWNQAGTLNATMQCINFGDLFEGEDN